MNCVASNRVKACVMSERMHFAHNVQLQTTTQWQRHLAAGMRNEQQEFT